jgi:L-tryptophan--pyruvate aminotransferase
MENQHTIDMAWGSPAFLEDYWKNVEIKTDQIKRTNNYEFGSRVELKRLIKQLHKKVKNTATTGRHIVVASGASQIIFGLMSVLRELDPTQTKAFAQPPHFSRFPILADYAKLQWTKTSGDLDTLNIITTPNNPDSALWNKKDPCKILDLCYNWPHYGEVVVHNHPISVFSFSKATGLASTRIGWAVIKDKILANKLEEWIENSTGGLSIDAQIKAECVLQHILDTPFFTYGEKLLSERWEKIKTNRVKFPFKVLNNNGMFLWAQGKCPSEILHIKGSSFGVTDDYFRLNIGCSPNDFERFILSFNSTI